MSLSVEARRRFKGFSLDVRLKAQGGEMLGILGASGAGKSMTLKAVAGLLTPDEGRIILNGRALYDGEARVDLRPQARGVGYLFQNYALFPHMTVMQNALSARGSTREFVRELLERLEIAQLSGRYPAQLSGGQQQRAALARCLAARPEALLLDEPFAALDEHLREKMQLELTEILKDFPGPTVMVTHSRDEAFKLCRRLVVIERGRVAAEGETRALFGDPGKVSVARLTGCKNISRARAASRGRVFCEDWGVELLIERPFTAGHTHVGVRARDFVPAPTGCVNPLPARVIRRVEGQFTWDVMVDAGGPEPIWWKVDKSSGMAAAEHLWVAPDRVMPLKGGEGEGSSWDGGR